MANSRSRSGAPHSRPQLRIIGGDWRGRKVQFAPVAGLRPTGDRLRETLFNWLQFQLAGTRCLDLFAGSGALGLEALSRGAQAVDFVELNRDAAMTLQRQLAALGAHNGQVHLCSAEQFLGQACGPYQLVFLDPPFAGALWQPMLAGVIPHLDAGAQVYVETPRDTLLSLPDGFRIEREKHAGRVCMRLLRWRQ
ncbi:16S rRNA (guanine(966)-N(2))-methyltransferase RsmD [Microbulbifer sp. 2201CG32-9]|uniref:16S rRNA (guanine(966)-N(2))-methyltransferase RsmD n=1 Tax=unclassified Microbulbifer TaxID=2619833 RepID=UPI00345BD16B